MGQNGVAVGVIGVGSIGLPVANALRSGKIDGAHLECVIDVSPPPLQGVDVVEVHEAIERCDVMIECSGPSVIIDHGEQILKAGVDLLICSVGALSDDSLAGSLREHNSGRLFVTNGAIGGLDMLAAAARIAPLDRVKIVTTKKPAPLVQPWMSDDESAWIRSLAVNTEIFNGTAREAVQAFPKSLNVAASVSLAIGNWESVNVSLRADPEATLTTHAIEASGPAGEYRFECCNYPSAENPRTSGVVPSAVLRSLENIVGKNGGVI